MAGAAVHCASAVLVTLVSYTVFVVLKEPDNGNSDGGSSSSNVVNDRFSWLDRSKNISHYVRGSALILEPKLTDRDKDVDILVLVVSSNCNSDRRRSIRRYVHVPYLVLPSETIYSAYNIIVRCMAYKIAAMFFSAGNVLH